MTEKNSCCPQPGSPGPSTSAEETPPCCPPAESFEEAQENAPCCRPSTGGERPGYRLWPFVIGWLDTPLGPVPQVATRLTTEDRFGRWQMRWGIGRMRYRIGENLDGKKDNDEDEIFVQAQYLF